MRIGVGGVSIGARAREYILDVIDTTRLTYGPYHRKFEAEFAALHDRRFAMFCNSGTSALQVALHALRESRSFNDGDEILVPSITFVATVNIVLQNGLKPVFVDVDPVYYCIDPEQIESRITDRTRAIIPVHMFGQPCDMQPILEIAARRKLSVLEDSAECMFARYDGAPVGSWGEISCFSTYAAHILATGVGGFATTNDPELAILIKSLINHGRDGIYLSIDDDRTDNREELFDIVDRRFRFLYPGYSFRATEFEAAIGLAQLEEHESMIAKRRERASWLSSGLRDLGDRLQLPETRRDTEHSYMMYPIVIRDESDSRDNLVHFLEENGIETRPMLPLLNQPVYINLFGDLEADYPNARLINRCGFYVGCHPEISREEIDYMLSKFHDFFGSA